MSNIEKIIKYIRDDKNRVALVGASLLLIIVLGVGIFSYFLGRNDADKFASPIPVIDLSKIASGGQKILGAQIYNWSGEVIALEDSTIIIDDSESSRQISATIGTSTELTRWDLTTPPAPETSNKTVISISDIKPGQQVLVKSSADVNAANEVTADSVTILITPSSK